MEYLVCAHRGHFADDVPAHCTACDAAIVHRPHANPRAVKVCESCAVALIASGAMPPRIAVTAETLREIVLFTAPTKGTQ